MTSSPGLRVRVIIAGLCGAALALGATASTAAAGAGALSVRGNHLSEQRGHKRVPVRLVGVNRSGSEYACTGDDGAGGKGFGIFQGPVDSRAVAAFGTWKINAVALPLNEACWLGSYGGLKRQYAGASYRNAIKGFVGRLERAGIHPVLRLSGAAPGSGTFGSDGGSPEIPMADADHSLAFWRSVAGTFKHDGAVLFGTYDEPNAIGWRCWLRGCRITDQPDGSRPSFGTYQAAGQQALVDAIRSTGAGQPIVISGVDFSFDLTQWRAHEPRDRRHALLAGFNSFDYGEPLGKAQRTLASLSRRVPILVGGFGDTDCNSDFSERLMSFADAHGMGYLAWTWNTTEDYGGCANALLGPLSGYHTGQPSGYGAGVRRHFLQIRR